MKRLAIAFLFVAHGAFAWDAATTHAGLTARAVAASTLQRRLGALFGLPGGAWETLRYAPATGDARGGRLRDRLDRLDASAGYRPDGGRLPAASWLVAGSVLEEVPSSRGRHHFFDPTTGRGLHRSGLLGGIGIGVASVARGVGTVRDLVAGEAFDGTGSASTEWLVAPDNELGLPRFLDARERAVIAPTPAERESALAEALLVAGALLHVIEDAADPPYVHNDERTDRDAGGAPLDAFAAARFGRLAVPAPSGAAESVPHLADLIHNTTGTGLADRTASRFFSRGLLAGDAESTRPPGLPALVPSAGRRGYLLDGERRHLARFERDAAGRVRWDLDARCLSDEAQTLLPDAARAALSAIEHLFRDPIVVEGATIMNGPLALGAGKVTVLAEDDDGTRHVVTSQEITTVAPRATIIELPENARSTRRLAVVFRGVDGNGEPIVTSVELVARE